MVSIALEIRISRYCNWVLVLSLELAELLQGEKICVREQ